MGEFELFNGSDNCEGTDNHDSLSGAMVKIIDAYNVAKVRADAKNKELDKAISEAQSLIAKGRTPLDEELIQALKKAISETKAAKIKIPAMPEAAEEISAVADNLNAINYNTILERLTASQEALEISIKQYELVDNPTEAYIIQCLKEVPNIVDISAATEDNDPNGRLNKADGYTAQVYFSSNLVNQNGVFGSTVIEKGTKCGGSIEVYTTTKNAIQRNNGLALYDDSILSSGSHTVIGTVVVRTSSNLTVSQQKKLEGNIIAALISLD